MHIERQDRIFAEILADRIGRGIEIKVDSVVPAMRDFLARNPGIIERLKAEPKRTTPTTPPPSPSRAALPQPKHDQSWWMKWAAKTFGPMLWREMHNWPTGNDPANAKQLIESIRRKLPCGDCKNHFDAMVRTMPPCTANKLCLAFTTWEWHNKVNREKENPSAQMTWEDAAKIYDWDKLNPDRSLAFWNYSDGQHAKMTNALIKSLRRNGVANDFLCWSPEPIPAATKNHKLSLSAGDKFPLYGFKFKLLKEQVAQLDYEYFCWLDADNYCVRNPGNLLDLMRGDPVHAFLESDCTNPKCKRADWWKMPLPEYVKLMHEMGVGSERVWNTNAGFFIVKRDAIPEFCDLADAFWKEAAKRGTRFTEEAPLAYATMMMVKDPDRHTQRRGFDVWASDWTGVYSNRLPDGSGFDFEDYMSGEKTKCNPAVIHLMRGDAVLAKAGE